MSDVVQSRLSLLAVRLVLLLYFFPAGSVWAQKPPITDLVFTPDGKSAVCCSQLGVSVYSWPDLELIKLQDVSASNLQCLAFSPDGSQLAVGGGNPADDGSVEVFAWPSFEASVKLVEHADSVASVVWKSNQCLVAASLDRTIFCWDVPTQTVIQRLQGHSRGVHAVCLLNTGELVSAGQDQTVRVWDVESAGLIRNLSQHTKPINAMAVCPQNEGRPLLATASGDRSIRFWQPTIGRMMRYVRLDSEPLDIDWINSSMIVASCVDGRLRLIDSENVQVNKSIVALQDWAYAVAVHPYDGSVAIAGSNGQIRRIEF